MPDILSPSTNIFGEVNFLGTGTVTAGNTQVLPLSTGLGLNVATSKDIRLSANGTNLIIFSTQTGGTGHFLKQASAGGAVTSGVIGTADLGSGTANTAAFLRGDKTWSNALLGSLTVTGSLSLATKLSFTSVTTISASKEITSVSAGLAYNVATGGTHDFSVNGASSASISSTLLTVTATNGIYLNSATGSVTAANRQIAGTSYGTAYNTPTSTRHSFRVNAVEIATIDSTGLVVANDPQDWFMYQSNYYR